MSGKIYKLYSKTDPTQFYVGSTKKAPNVRLSQHKHAALTKTSSKKDKKMIELGVENFEMELLEEHKDISLEQLRLVEEKYIRKLKPTLNGTSAASAEKMKPLYICACGLVTYDYFEEHKNIYKTCSDIIHSRNPPKIISAGNVNYINEKARAKKRDEAIKNFWKTYPNYSYNGNGPSYKREYTCVCGYVSQDATYYGDLYPHLEKTGHRYDDYVMYMIRDVRDMAYFEVKMHESKWQNCKRIIWQFMDHNKKPIYEIMCKCGLPFVSERLIYLHIDEERRACSYAEKNTHYIDSIEISALVSLYDD